MADEQAPIDQAAAGQQTPQAQFSIERIFLKDMSLETPQGMAAFAKEWQPRIDLDINTTQSQVDDGLYETVLRLTVTVKEQESDTIFYLIEVHQAGLFRVSGLGDEDLRRVLATMAPTTLFPYARETVDSLVVKANFPPLRLAPINFDALLVAAIQRQQQAEQEGSGSTTVQ